MKDSKGHVKKRLLCGASHGFRPLLTASCPALQEMYLESGALIPSVSLRSPPNYILSIPQVQMPAFKAPRTENTETCS